jgi:hypothetical protein
LEGNGHGPNQGTIFNFFPEALSKNTKISGQTAGVPADIQTEHYPNTNLEYNHYANKFHLHLILQSRYVY